MNANTIVVAPSAEQNAAVLNGLVAVVVSARSAFTSAVQAAAAQSITHFLVYGDTSFLTRLQDTFTKGTLGGKNFTLYCEKFGGVELAGKTSTKAARFIKCEESFNVLPIFDADDVVSIDLVIAYLKTLPTNWEATKAPKAEEEEFDLDGAIVALLKKAKAKEDKCGVNGKVLLSLLEGTVGKFHAQLVGGL